MNYESSMAGLQQIFDAILSQQLQPRSVEVDEMTMGQQSIADALGQINPEGTEFGSLAAQAASAIPGKEVKKGNIPYSQGGM